MSKFNWLFSRVLQNEDEDEPMGEEFFVNSESLTNVSLLVREAVQNSIDACLDRNRPVSMRFHVGILESKLSKKYFETLMPHVESALNFNSQDALSERQLYLVVEDFNTKGLKGRTISNRPQHNLAEPDKDSFWFFEWKVGESNKDTNSGGKWGVGKVVFSFVSLIKTYMVFSSRGDEAAPDGNPNILFGHNVMKCHDAEDGNRCKAKHRLMKLDDDENYVPFDEEEIIKEFNFDWKLGRNLGEKGTSIVVPFCFTEFNAKTITQALAQDYFIAFLDGGLECEISDDLGNPTVILNKHTLMENIQELPETLITEASKTKDQLLQLCMLYSAKGNPETMGLEIKIVEDSPNQWKTILLSTEEKDVFAEALEQLKPVIFDVEVKIPKRKAKDQYEVANFQVYIQKRDGMKLRTTFCRQGILIPDAGKGISEPADFVTLVYIPKGPLADFLGVAEDPSHKSWTSKQAKFKEYYKPEKFSQDGIAFVRYATSRLISSSKNTGSEKDKTSLSKYFPIVSSGITVAKNPTTPQILLSKILKPRENSEVTLRWEYLNFNPLEANILQISPSKSKISIVSSAKEYTCTLDDVAETYSFKIEARDAVRIVESNMVTVNAIRSKATQLDISLTQTGFQIKNVDKSKIEIGDELLVTVAYDQRDGGALRSWTSQDFTLQDKFWKAKKKGIDIAFNGNQATVKVIEKDFSLEFRNFDLNRDLVVDARLAN